MKHSVRIAGNMPGNTQTPPHIAFPIRFEKNILSNDSRYGGLTTHNKYDVVFVLAKNHTHVLNAELYIDTLPSFDAHRIMSGRTANRYPLIKEPAIKKRNLTVHILMRNAGWLA
jgi:hypothetical protein